MLYHIIERIRDCRNIDVIVVATTTSPDDKILLKRAREYQVHGFAGSQHDLVKRFLAVSTIVNADVIVRVPCDNPLMEPTFVDDCVELLEREKADYCYVDDAVLGTGVDVFTREALKKVDQEATQPHHREHIITYFKENPEKFEIVTTQASLRYKLPELRLTLDTREDLDLLRILYHKFYREETVVSLVKVMNFIRQNPEVAGLNAEIVQKQPTESELEEQAAAEEAARKAEELAAKQAEELAAKQAEEQAAKQAEELAAKQAEEAEASEEVPEEPEQAEEQEAEQDLAVAVPAEEAEEAVGPENAAEEEQISTGTAEEETETDREEEEQPAEREEEETPLGPIQKPPGEEEVTWQSLFGDEEETKGENSEEEKTDGE